MKKRVCELAAVLGVALLTVGALAGCGSTGNGSTGQNLTAIHKEEEFSGKISLSGSTSMQKLNNALCESFMEKYPNVVVTAEYTGSGTGIEAVIAGQCDIGNSSRNLKEEEIKNGAVENIVAIDGIAVVVDKDNTLKNITKNQLISIYTGTITNWSVLGGADVPIVVIGREAGSGTRGAFEEILKIEEQCTYANELDSTGAVMARVASTPGAIAYVSLDIIDDTVTALSLDGVEANAEKIKAGEYLLSRPFIMATKGEISEQSELLKAWFDYCMGEEGQAVVTKVGLITVE